MITSAERNRDGWRVRSGAKRATSSRGGLSRAEEKELAGSIANGDRDARNSLVQANLSLVARVARDFQGRGMDLDDLIGEGNLGLIRAAEEYNPSFGTRFSTYAVYWIKEKIRTALIDTSATIRLPRHMFRLLTAWRRAEWMLCCRWGRVPTFEEVAQVLELKPAQKSLVARAHRAHQLTFTGSYTGASGSSAIDELGDPRISREEMFEPNDEWAAAERRIERLETRERDIVALHFGLNGRKSLTLREIGRRYGVTRECVRKIELGALRKLKDGLTGGKRPGVDQPRGAASGRKAAGKE